MCGEIESNMNGPNNSKLVYKRNIKHGRAICYFQLLWVILIGLIFALIIQSLAANLGVSTGKMQSKQILGQNIEVTIVSASISFFFVDKEEGKSAVHKSKE